MMNFVFFLLVFLPNNQFSSYVQLFITILILILKFKRNILTVSNTFKIYFLYAIIASLIFAIVSSTTLTLTNTIKVINIYVLLAYFPLTDNYRLNNKYIILSLFIILLSQLSYLFNLSLLIDIVEKIYSRDYSNSSEVLALEGKAEFGGSFRFGGLFRNPNHCGRIVTLLLGIYLINKEKIQYQIYLIITLSLVSVFLTGSRTAFLVSIILLFFYFTFIQKQKKISRINIALLIIIMLYITINTEFRVFNIIEDTSSKTSLGAKFEFFNNYFNNINFGQFLIGNFNIDEVDYNFNNLRISKFDFEYGYLFHGFGLIGMIMILSRLLYIFLKGNLKTRFLFVIFLWTVSSTILTNFRFSLIFILALSFYYPRFNKSINNS